MRNLFLGYFHTPKNKRGDVLKLMGGVLGLNREDIDKVSSLLSRSRRCEQPVSACFILLRTDVDLQNTNKLLIQLQKWEP